MGEKSEIPVILICGPIYSQSLELGKLIAETYQVPHFSLDDIILRLIPSYTKTQRTNYIELMSLLKHKDLSSIMSKTFTFFNELIGQKKPIILSGSGIEFAVNSEISVLLKLNIVTPLEFRVRHSHNTFGMDELSTIDMYYKDIFKTFVSCKARYELTVTPQTQAEETFATVSKESNFITAISEFKTTDDISIIKRTKCLVCGLTYEGKVEVNICPRCGNMDMDKFRDG